MRGELDFYEPTVFPHGKGSIFSQITFAARTVELKLENANNLASALIFYTTICRGKNQIRIPHYGQGGKRWHELVDDSGKLTDNTAEITEMVWQSYIAASEPYQSLGNDEFTRGSFIYRMVNDYVVFHANPHRSTHEYSRVNCSSRAQDLKELTEEIKKRVKGKTVGVLAMSWMNNLPCIREVFPKEFVDSGQKVNPDFRSDSLWGQLMDNEGRAKPNMVEPLVEKIRRAKSIGGLSKAFPLPTILMRGNTKMFYDWYGV